MGPGKDQAIPLATRFTILLHLPGRHTAEEVAGAMIKAMRQLPADLRRTITWDRGSEMTGYKQVQLALGADVYFWMRSTGVHGQPWTSHPQRTNSRN